MGYSQRAGVRSAKVAMFLAAGQYVVDRLGHDGAHPPKLFEFNCDTPTSLLEAERFAASRH